MKLVSYCKQRLEIYATQIESISQPDLAAAFAEGSDGVALARELHSLSAKFKADRSLETLQKMISVAYRLRYEPAPDSSSGAGKRASRIVCFLGRLRAAYETFKETAIQLQRWFSKLTVVCLQAPEAGPLPRNQYERRIEELAGKNGIPWPKKGRIANALGKGAAVLTPCHAEVQILMHFESCIPPMAESSTKPERIESGVNILKDFICSRECLKIPATGESPHLVSIKFYGYPDDYHGREPSPFCIPHFSAYWGISNFDRAYRRITVTKQNPEALDGEYLFYWCRNTALSPNQNLMSLLGIEMLRIDEHFWYGDILITHFHEDDETFEFTVRTCLGHIWPFPLAMTGHWSMSHFKIARMLPVM